MSAGSRSVTLNGLTVQGPAWWQTGSAPPSRSRFVDPLGLRSRRWGAQRPGLVLHDAAGRSYREILPNPRLPLPAHIQNITSGDGVTAVYNALFPPLPARSGRAGPSISTMTITQETPDLQIRVPVTHGRVAPTTDARSDQLSAYHVRVLGATIEQSPGGRDLVLRLDLGGWREGRNLIHLMRVGVTGDYSSSWAHAGHNDVHQWIEVGVPEPETAGETITVTLRGATVAVRGLGA